MRSKKLLSFKEAAIRVLRAAGEPLSAQEITERALQEGILQTAGKTPSATMAAQIYVEINTQRKSQFKKVGKGKFALRDQLGKDDTSSPLLFLEKHNVLVRAALHKKLQEMDPYQFELLIADLLKQIGYEDGEVTKRTGDKGIDINATLTMGGITDVKTIIQVKKWKSGNNVSGKVITQLRGSAEVDQRGLVITTSKFTKDAAKESRAPNKMPVSMIDGDKLLDLLMEHGVGIKKESVELYSLDNTYFDHDPETEDQAAVSGKNRSIWPLPGGNQAYLETLFMHLAAIQEGRNTKSKLVDWYKKTFESVNSDNTANGYVYVPKSMGLTSFVGGRIVLTEAGRKVLESRDRELLYQTISENILAFDDIVELIRTSGNGQSQQEILAFVNENFDVEWTTYAQVEFRLLWLCNLGKLKKLESRYVLGEEA